MAVSPDAPEPDAIEREGLPVAIESDEDLCRRIRGRDATALGRLLAREHATAELLARVVAADGEPGDALPRAWERLIADIVSGTVEGDLRAALSERLLIALEEASALDADTPAPSAPRGFLPQDDRWAGWWAVDPEPWPEEVAFPPEAVVRALRRLPLGPRVLLTLRDGVGLSPGDVQVLVRVVPGRQGALLDAARAAFVEALEGMVER